jgi:imidazolonepropionase-like amidohydrolase
MPHAGWTLDSVFSLLRVVGTYRSFVYVAMRDAIVKGYFPGPRMFVAGAYLTITGGGGTMSGDLAPDIGLPWDLRFGVADGVDQVRHVVRAQLKHGVDLIKVLATGAFLAHGSDPHAVE